MRLAKCAQMCTKIIGRFRMTTCQSKYSWSFWSLHVFAICSILFTYFIYYILLLLLLLLLLLYNIYIYIIFSPLFTTIFEHLWEKESDGVQTIAGLVSPRALGPVPSNSDGPGRELEDQWIVASSMKFQRNFMLQDASRLRYFKADSRLSWNSMEFHSFFKQASQSCHQQVHARLDHLDHTQSSLLEKAQSCFDLSQKAISKSVEDLFWVSFECCGPKKSHFLASYGICMYLYHSVATSIGPVWLSVAIPMGGSCHRWISPPCGRLQRRTQKKFCTATTNRSIRYHKALYASIFTLVTRSFDLSPDWYIEFDLVTSLITFRICRPAPGFLKRPAAHSFDFMLQMLYVVYFHVIFTCFAFCSSMFGRTFPSVRFQFKEAPHVRSRQCAP